MGQRWRWRRAVWAARRRTPLSAGRSSGWEENSRTDREGDRRAPLRGYKEAISGRHLHGNRRAVARSIYFGLLTAEGSGRRGLSQDSGGSEEQGSYRAGARRLLRRVRCEIAGANEGTFLTFSAG